MKIIYWSENYDLISIDAYRVLCTCTLLTYKICSLYNRLYHTSSYYIHERCTSNIPLYELNFYIENTGDSR